MREFLKKESQKWVDSEIITQEQLGRIYDLYPVSKSNSLVVVFAIIGSLLVGTGIILIFASNWWSIPIFIRAVLAFIPLLIAQGIGMYCYKNNILTTAFREGVGVFLMLAVFANIALIGQIFHTGSDLYTYMAVCLLLSLPSIYSFDSFAALTAYMAATVAICFFGISRSSARLVSLLPLLLVVAILPFIIKTLQKELSSAKEKLVLTLSALVTIAFLSFLTWTLNSRASFALGRMVSFISLLDYLVMAPMVLIALDAFYNYWRKKNEMTSFKAFGIIMQSAFLIISVFSTFLFNEEYVYPTVLLFSILLYLAPKWRTNRWFVPTDSITIATIILVLFQYLWPLDIVITSSIIFLLGIYFVYVGSKKLTFRHLNYGLLLTFGVILVRFFSSDLSILVRGIIFLILGISFLVINLRLSKKRKELAE